MANSESKANVYEIVTQKVIESMEKGNIPWKKPWASIGMPRNLVSNLPYSGINLFLLSMAPYSSPYWLTYKQAQDKGGHVKKGEKAHLVVFWQQRKFVDVGPDGEEKEKTIPLLRYYNVYNLEQCEGIAAPATLPVREHPPIESCEAIVAAYVDCPPVEHGGDRACYSPTFDKISMPPKKNFGQAEHYYGTLFHEMAHSTGHKSRLNRDLSGTFGNHDYSFEELVAEFTSSFLSANAGIDAMTIENSAAYIKHWSEKLRKDPKMLMKASGQASKAANWILGKKKAEPKVEKEG